MLKFNTLFIIVFYIITCFTSTSAQEFKRLINDSIYWDIQPYVSGVYNGSICNTSLTEPSKRYFFKGDSVINTVTYKKVCYYELKGMNQLSYCPPYLVDTIMKKSDILIVEDVINNKILRYSENGDILLFDFNKQKGDTIAFEHGAFIIDTVYEIEYGWGVKRKKFEGQNGYYIEGLGGPQGPFLEPFNIFELGYTVLCTSSFNNATSNCSKFITSFPTQYQLGVKPYKIYPNPFTFGFQLESKCVIQKLEIFNSTGVRVHQKFDNTLEYIDTKSFKPGIYILKLLINNKVYFEELVKQ